MSGDPEPDCTGAFERIGWYEGAILYKHTLANFWLWFNPGIAYYITDDYPPMPPPTHWWHSVTLEGEYEHEGLFEGHPQVTENP